MKKIIVGISLLAVTAVVAPVTMNRKSQPVAPAETKPTQEQPPAEISPSQPRNKESHCHECAEPPPKLAGGVILLVRRDGYIYALDASTGSKKWMSGGGYTSVRVEGSVIRGREVFVPTYNSIWSILLDDGGRTDRFPDVDADRLYASKSHLYASGLHGELWSLDIASGQQEWQAKVKYAEGEAERGTYDDNTVQAVAGGLILVVRDDGALHAISVRTGRELWRFRPAGKEAVSLVAVGDSAYVVGEGGALYAIDLRSGRRKWTFTGEEGYPHVRESRDNIYLSTGRRLYAIDRRRGTRLWSFDTKGYAISKFALAGDAIVLAGHERATETDYIYCVSKKSGKRLWRFNVSFTNWEPVVNKTTAYFAGRFGVYAVSLRTGTLKWKFQLAATHEIGSSLAVKSGLVYFESHQTGDLSEDVTLYAVDAKTGSQRWRLRRDEIESEPPQKTSQESLSQAEARRAFAQMSHRIVKTIKDQDGAGLSMLVHPQKGVRFSPYSYVSPGDDKSFNRKQVTSLFQSNRRYIWGREFGGDAIRLTAAGYFKHWVYDRDFLRVKRIGYNEIIAGGTAMNCNLYEVYPNAIFVSYFDPGTHGLDWKSLILGFEKHRGKWYLVAIVHNDWTP